MALPSTDTERTLIITLPDSFGYANIGTLSSFDEVESATVGGQNLTVVFNDTGAININFDIYIKVNKDSNNYAGKHYAMGEHIPVNAVYTAKRGGTDINRSFVADYAVMMDSTDSFSFTSRNSTFTVSTNSEYYRYIPSSSFDRIKTSAELLNGRKPFF